MVLRRIVENYLLSIIKYPPYNFPYFSIKHMLWVLINHNMVLWRIVENYLLIIIKYPPYNFPYFSIKTYVVGTHEWVPTIYGFTENCREFFNYHQIPTLSVALYRTSSDAAEHEPRHDKTNKMSVRPAKTQISLGIHPVWSVFAVRSMGS